MEQAADGGRTDNRELSISMSYVADAKNLSYVITLHIETVIQEGEEDLIVINY